MTTSTKPAESTSFVGRVRDVADLARLFGISRLVTLCGTGGIGKTRLASHVAASLACGDHGVVVDAAVFVPLADVLEADQVVRTVTAAVQVPAEQHRPPADTLADALASRNLLLVLDNCEQVIDGCAALAHRLLQSCPQLRILATSREPLRIPGEHVWRVPPLIVPRADWQPAADRPLVDQLDDAVTLFADRARAVRPGFEVTEQNATTVAQLCRALDGLPLALELAAACSAFLDVDEIADRLDDRFRLLTEGSRVAPCRQRTLRAAVDWSHGLLGSGEQTLFRRLSVFRGGWSLGAAEAVCAGDGLEPRRVLPLLRHLVDVSLVVADHEDHQGGTRYRMLETIREYAAERLAEAKEKDAARQRHYDWALDLLDEGWDVTVAREDLPAAPRMAMVQELLREMDNVRAALAFCDEEGKTLPGLEMCASNRYVWYAIGMSTETRVWMERFLPTNALESAAKVPGRALFTYAEACREQGDPATAGPYARAALDALLTSGDRATAVLDLVLLGDLALLHGEADQARTYVTEALRTAEAVGRGSEISWALQALGICAELTGNFEEAEGFYQRALEIRQRMEQPYMCSYILRGLGRLATRRGDKRLAAAYFDGVRAGFNAINGHAHLFAHLTEVARIDIEAGDPALARERLREGLPGAQGLGRRLDVANALDGFAELARAEGDEPRALRLTGAVAEIRRRQGVTGQGPDRPPRTVQSARFLAEGAAMTVEEAIAYAMESSDLPEAAPLLSAREEEVAELLARGLTNRQLAVELHISPGTAARHVANILAKLGLSSRTQVAVWISERNQAH